MHDVAARAGVALSSVSRALGNHPDVSKRMRRRVLEAANELGYEPNFLAQSLRTGNTQTVGFVVRDIANPFFAAIANGAERFLRERGYVMLLVNSDGDPDIDANHINVLRRRRVDGLILNIIAEDHRPTLDALAGMRSPIVLVDREIPELDARPCSATTTRGVRAATADLIDHGHRRIALITGPQQRAPGPRAHARDDRGAGRARHRAGPGADQARPLRRVVRLRPDDACSTPTTRRRRC